MSEQSSAGLAKTKKKGFNRHYQEVKEPAARQQTLVNHRCDQSLKYRTYKYLLHSTIKSQITHLKMGKGFDTFLQRRKQATQKDTQYL